MHTKKQRIVPIFCGHPRSVKDAGGNMKQSVVQSRIRVKCFRVRASDLQLGILLTRLVIRVMWWSAFEFSLQ